MFSCKNAPYTLALFCKVVDNFGDIGICWRLSRQLQHEHGINVTLWVDDLQSFQRICPEASCSAPVQQVAGVTVRRWQAGAAGFSIDDIADIVIEFFGCEIPADYITAMAAMTSYRPQPVWLNLEGLSAEEWVEGCHGLPSPHPRLPLTKYFFFPGFTDRTGGLLHEGALADARKRFQADPVIADAFLAQLGVTPQEAATLKVSLFCYPHAPVDALLSAWQSNDRAITCLVPERVAVPAIEAFLGTSAIAGAMRTCGALTVRVVPFVAQPDYDRLLWACDLNFVRGEDSFVRAQWAGRPFVWHIYPQDKNLHHVKLRAFLQRYAGSVESLASATLHWNDALSHGAPQESVWPEVWQRLQAALPAITDSADGWERKMRANGDLATNLLQFAATVRQATALKPA